MGERTERTRWGKKREIVRSRETETDEGGRREKRVMERGLCVEVHNRRD